VQKISKLTTHNFQMQASCISRRTFRGENEEKNSESTPSRFWCTAVCSPSLQTGFHLQSFPSRAFEPSFATPQAERIADKQSKFANYFKAGLKLHSNKKNTFWFQETYAQTGLLNVTGYTGSFRESRSLSSTFCLPITNQTCRTDNTSTFGS
jgi:hypothetical protein